MTTHHPSEMARAVRLVGSALAIRSAGNLGLAVETWPNSTVIPWLISIPRKGYQQ